MSDGFLKNTVKLYSYLGFWPLIESSNFFEKLRRGLGLFLVINSAIYNAFQYYDIYNEWGSLKYFSENIAITSLNSIYLFKVFVFYNHRDDIVSIVKEMDFYELKIMLEYINNDNCDKINYLRKTKRRFDNYIYFFWTISFLTATVMFFGPASTLIFTQNFSLRPLLTRAYIPFSLNSLGIYAAVYLVELVIGFLTVLHTLAFDSYFIGCILFAIGRLKILQYSIEMINKRASEKLFRQNINEDIPLNDDNYLTRDKFQKIISIELKLCVEEHKQIIKFCKKIDSILSIILFAKFFLYAVVICFTGFYMMLIEISLDFLILGQYLSALMVETFFYYWYGNELMTESLNVVNSVMKSDWQNIGKRNINTIIFIMFRSQKPILLTAGKFYTITLSTLLTLLKSSYSYFALLKQFYDQ